MKRQRCWRCSWQRRRQRQPFSHLLSDFALCSAFVVAIVAIVAVVVALSFCCEMTHSREITRRTGESCNNFYVAAVNVAAWVLAKRPPILTCHPHSVASWGASHNMGQLDTSHATSEQPHMLRICLPNVRSIRFAFCLLSLSPTFSLPLSLSPSRLMALLNLQDMCIIFKRTMRLSRSLNAPPATAATCHICHTPPATWQVSNGSRSLRQST